MTCKKCGGTMNPHAQKYYAAEAGESEEAVGDTLLEVFACPHCGYVDARPVVTGR